MKRTKLPLIAILIILVVTLNTIPCFSTSLCLQIDNPLMAINGTNSEIDPGIGTSPVIINSRTLVPIRAIIEAFGGTVDWDGDKKEITLSLEATTVMMTIDSTTVYLNGNPGVLDVAPVIIGDRTMLPVRFVSESFGLKVSWEDSTKTIKITDGKHPEIPTYSGEPYVVINNNIPMFADEITNVSFEQYSDLDGLGRCGVCIASVGRDTMPTVERGNISSIIPTGWHSVEYDVVDGGYLYNRCHLIGYQLTAENANEENIITGTRYMNVDGMLPFENMVADYVEETGNHVMYRVTPFFAGSYLVANGVLLEGYSVEDMGKGISFCVYCYNVQPGINIDYSSGESYAVLVDDGYISESAKYNFYILNTNSKKFHNPQCYSAGMIKAEYRAESEEARDVLISNGYSPCGNCKP